MSDAVLISPGKELDLSDYREICSEATFTISSAKPGNGVEQLRDNNLDTYWQSDGSFPHFINVQFLRKVSASKVCLYLDYTGDESYTPKKIAVGSGTSTHDVMDILTVELTEPTGWVTLTLPAQTGDANSDSPLQTIFLQVKVLSMHQNGRDSHIRQIKILGPRTSPRVMGDFTYDNFKTVTMQQFALIR
jgi:anaphase-promoting complex subunit 10